MTKDKAQNREERIQNENEITVTSALKETAALLRNSLRDDVVLAVNVVTACEVCTSAKAAARCVISLKCGQRLQR